MRPDGKINTIMSFLRGMTSSNFQQGIWIVFKFYYQSRNLTFVSPNPSGGDFKNDGYIKELKIFYQLFSPEQSRKSFKQEIIKKFGEDLSGLLNHVYREGMWGGVVERFYFITNTFDNELPAFQNDQITRLVDSINLDFGTNINAEIVNLDYIEKLLFEMDDSTLFRIMTVLRLDSDGEDTIEEVKDLVDLIKGICSEAQLDYFRNSRELGYQRISTEDKVKLNDLDSEFIEKLLLRAYLVEEAIEFLRGSLSYEFEILNVIDVIQKLYTVEKDKLKGMPLFLNLVNIIHADFCQGNRAISIEIVNLLVAYVFDLCDIFEKDVILNDSSK